MPHREHRGLINQFASLLRETRFQEAHSTGVVFQSFLISLQGVDEGPDTDLLGTVGFVGVEVVHRHAGCFTRFEDAVDQPVGRCVVTAFEA